MPRVSRFAVEFSIPSEPDVVWQALFKHQHCSTICPHNPDHVLLRCKHFKDGRALHSTRDCPDPRGIMLCASPKVVGVDYRIDHGPDLGKTIKVQHVTTVQLRHKGKPVFLTGTAPCSLSDVYNWRKGIHLALQRACEKAGYCKLEKVNGTLRIVDRKPIYGEIMEAFWREVQLKAPEQGTPVPRPEAGPSAGGTEPTTVSAMVVAGPSGGRMALLHAAARRHDIAHGLGGVEVDFPVENRMGLGYAGMD